MKKNDTTLNLSIDELCDLTTKELFSIYKSNSPFLSIATFLENMNYDENDIEETSIEISNRFDRLGLIECQKVQGKFDKNCIKFNRGGFDFIKEFDSFSEFIKYKDIKNHKGLKPTPKKVKQLNDLFLFKYHNSNEYFLKVKDISNATKVELENFICEELEWITSQYIDDSLIIVNMNKIKAIEFIDNGMFNYLLDNSKNEEKSNNIVINVSQSQSQTQSIHISIINELESTLTKNEFEEIRKILSLKSSEKTKAEKIKEFLATLSVNSLAGALGNIISKGVELI